MSRNRKHIFNMLKLWLPVFIGLIFLNGCLDLEENQDTIRIKELVLKIKSPKVLIIHDATDKYGIDCYRQTKQALDYGKISYQEFDMSQSTILPELDTYCSLLTVTENLWKFNKIESNKVKKFVGDGGGLVVIFRAWNEYLADVFGVKNRTEPKFYESDQTLIYVKEFLPGSKDLKLSREDISNYNFEIQEGALLIAKTEKFPIVWRNQYGKGRVIYWNTGQLARKINRGFITRSIGAVQPFTTAIMANIGLFDLDDYPNSSYNIKLEPIKSELDMTISEFYVLQWYPDMLKLARKYGLKYSALAIFNYNGQTTPPFQFFEWLNGEITFGNKKIKSSLYAVKTLTDITELGLHGYNHQPLTIKNWGSIDNMQLALSASRERWGIDNLGDLPNTYVPPLNIYDSTGVQAVRHVFPTIKQIGALYLGSFAAGQYREFGPEPWDNELYVIPRNTSGFILTEFFKRSMISLLACNGVWVHFIHPDDVFPMGERYDEYDLEEADIKSLRWRGEPERNGLYYQMDKWLEFSKEYYPWLRFMTRKKAYEVMQYYDKTKMNSAAQGNIVNLEINVVPSYFTFYLQDKNAVEGLISCELLHEYQTEFGSQYIFKATDNIMMLQFENDVFKKGN